MAQEKLPQLPQIFYEEPQPGQPTNNFPYIEVEKNGIMPPVLFIFEYRHTGETEPGANGEEVQIIDQIPHKYVDMELLKEKLSPETNDMVRVAIGMQPLQKAKEQGQKILDKVSKNVESLKKEKVQA